MQWPHQVAQRRKRWPGRVLLLLVCGTWCAGVSAARAQVSDVEPVKATADADHARARLSFERGRALYDQGDFPGAASAFEAAYALSGKPELLYNLYLAERDRHAVEAAASALRRYLEQAESVTNRPQHEARLVQLERAVSEQRQARVPAPALPVPTADAVVMGPVATQEVAPSEEDSRWWRPAAALTGGGALLMVAAIPTGVLARNTSQELRTACEGMSPCDETNRSLADRRDALALTTDALLISGLVVVLAGVAWLVAGRPDEHRSTVGARRFSERLDIAPGGGVIRF